MKKLLSLILALLLLLSAFALVACDTEDDKDTKETKPVTQKKETDDDDDEEEETTEPVKTADQKTAQELYDEAFALLSNMTQYDVVSTMTIEMSMGQEPYSVQSTIEAKKGTDSGYTKIYTPATDFTAGSISEVWYANGVGYAYDGETKQKFEGVAFDTFADIMIVGFEKNEDWVAAEEIDWTKADHKKTDSGFTSTLPMSTEVATTYAEELSDFVTSVEGSLILTYDKNGVITAHTVAVNFKDADTGMDHTLEQATVYNSINKPVTVSAPADADEYVTGTFEGGSGNGGNSGVSDDEWGADWMYDRPLPQPVDSRNCGDLDGDGKTTEFDWYMMIEVDVGDENRDGVVNRDDITYLENNPDQILRAWDNTTVPYWWGRYAAEYGPNAA
ncbi:MAG: hypothetical protein E7668_03000 [Ruminococcaceae bacterium]|nr:hypothetical protein [Oscillospiraceae bacterium]